MYYRESIASFATALERFYEYIIKIISISVEKSISINSWKFVSNQSERQLGAFYYLFVREFNQEPKILSNKMVELRNKVIHKGYFPNEEETYTFLYEILEIINFNYNILFHKKEDEIKQYKEVFENEIWKSSIDRIDEEVKLYEIELKKMEENPTELPKLIGRYPLNKPVKKSFKRNIPTFLFLDGNFRYRNNDELREYIEKTKYYGID